MKRFILVIALILYSFSSKASVGVVDLGAVFNFHPYVLLYYYPEYNAFMRPISGPLSSSNIDRVRKDRAKRAAQLSFKQKRESKELDAKISLLKSKYSQIQRKIQHERQLNFERVQTILSKKGANIAEVNAKAGIELSKKTAPLKEKLLKISNELRKTEAEKKEVLKESFYINFTNSKETKELNDKIIKEIKDAIDKVSSSIGISLVLNSSFWKKPVSNKSAIIDRGINPDYNRIMTLTGEWNEEHRSKSELKRFSEDYISDIINAKDYNIPESYMGKFILGQYTDMTLAVVKLLQKNSKINPKVKKAITRYLQYKTIH